MKAPPFLSIIVPVLNEAALLGEFLRHLRDVAPSAELIVVDGGSCDGSVEAAKPFADAVITTRRGRGVQMNAGAAVAHGEALWFVHADLDLPADAPQRIARTLNEADSVGGCFRLRFPRRPAIYRVSDSLGNIGVDLFGFALGDHAIFCRRAAFERIGGYSDVPILEDAEFYRALRRVGRMVQLRQHVDCSPRAYERYGPCRNTAVYLGILVLYVCGVPIHLLYRIYRRFRGEAFAATSAEHLAATNQ